MTQTVSGLLTQPTLLPASWPPRPRLPSHSLRCGSCVEVNWTRSFLNSCHCTHPPRCYCVLFSFGHTHTQTHRDNGPSALSDTGQEISVYVDEAPLPAPSRRVTPPLLNRGSICVSGFHLPSKTLTLDIIPSESSLSLHFMLLSHLIFLILSLFLILTVSLPPSFSLLLLAVENNGVLLVDFTFTGTFTFIFFSRWPNKCVHIGFFNWQHRDSVLH